MKITTKDEIDNKNFQPKFEKTFGIKDEAFILQILRTNTYSDPIGSICREVISNCRDSHREAGKSDIPVEVELVKDDLSESKISLVFRDFGVGLSPERVNEVYTVYGESTKRTSNEFTGGFGLGAKTPFAYTDSFSVVTIHNGVKYTYQLVIDKSEKGKVIEVDRQLSELPNQTEVIIPIEEKDISKFTEKLLYSVSYWDIKPKFIGFEDIRFNGDSVISYLANLQNQNIFYQNKFGKIVKTDNLVNNETCIVLIDKIAYPLNFSSLKRNKLDERLDYRSKTLIIEFGNGEIDLSVSREQLYYSKKTIVKVERKITQFINSTKSDLENEISILKTPIEKLHWYKTTFYEKWYSIYDLFYKVKSISDKLENEISDFRDIRIHYIVEMNSNKQDKGDNFYSSFSTYCLYGYYKDYFNGHWWTYPVVIKSPSESFTKSKIETLKQLYPNGFIIAEKRSHLKVVKEKKSDFNWYKRIDYLRDGKRDIHLIGKYFKIQKFRNILKTKLEPQIRIKKEVDTSKKTFKCLKFKNGNNELQTGQLHKNDIIKDYHYLIVKVDKKEFDNLTYEYKLLWKESNVNMLRRLVSQSDKKGYFYQIIFLHEDEIESFQEMFSNSLLLDDFMKTFLTKDMIKDFVNMQKLLLREYHKLEIINFDELSEIDSRVKLESIILSVYESQKGKIKKQPVLDNVIRLVKNKNETIKNIYGLYNSNLLFKLTGNRLFNITQSDLKNKSLFDSIYKPKFILLSYIDSYDLSILLANENGFKKLTEYIIGELNK